MPIGFLLASALFMFAPAQTSAPNQEPLSNTFVTGAETVVDYSIAIDIKADDAHFDGQMQQLKLAKSNLNSMASGDREHDVVLSTNDLVFLISACHIQAKDGGDTTKCQSQVDRARNRTMYLINKHKTAGAWADGPPS
jgi:hypothetical protein